MAILIPKMEMPESCIDCPCQYDFISCQVLEKGILFNEEGQYLPDIGIDPYEQRLPECPLIEVIEKDEHESNAKGNG